jgi:hypothetical protein
MSIQLNHTIVSARHRDDSARFLTELFDLPPPLVLGPFAIVKIGETSLDYIESDGEIHPQHYAFLVSELEFDQIFERIRARGLSYWADPSRRNEGRINTWDGGRGVYWNDPNGHLLEIISRPYGSGGTTTTNPHPLVTAETG